MIFSGFTFASEVLLGRIATFYGFSIPEADSETSLADFVGARLQGRPNLGDHISFTDKRLVIQEMDGGQITKVGLELAFVQPVCLREHEPQALAVQSHQGRGCS